MRSSGEDLIIHGTYQTVAGPGQVSGLRTVAGRHQVALSWTPVAGAESYTVRWGTTPGGPYPNSQSGLTQSLATINALTANQPYYFTAVAQNTLGTGPASLEKTATQLTSFDAWRNLAFTPTQIAAGQFADAADPDGDGWKNLLEYAFGSDPMQASAVPPIKFALTGLPQRMSVTLPLWTDKDDIIITLEASADLVTWTALAQSTAGSPVIALVNGVTVDSTGSAPATVTVFDDLAEVTSPHRFLRIKVLRP